MYLGVIAQWLHGIAIYTDVAWSNPPGGLDGELIK